MLATTLTRIREHGPCLSGWEKLLKFLCKTGPDDTLLPFHLIVQSNGLEDALWCCRAEPQYDWYWRTYLVWSAYQVKSLLIDQRSITAVEVAERYLTNEATLMELSDARFAAWEASRIHDRYIPLGMVQDHDYHGIYQATLLAAGCASGKPHISIFATTCGVSDKHKKKFLEIVCNRSQ